LFEILKEVLRIWSGIGFGFSWVCEFGSGLEIWVYIGEELPTKKKYNLRNFMFEVLDFLYRRLEASPLAGSLSQMPKKFEFFPTIIFLNFLSSKT
jgi:hypothetical protein